jgi:hypothetical protein
MNVTKGGKRQGDPLDPALEVETEIEGEVGVVPQISNIQNFILEI